ncbi:hypothetical protein SUGI_0716000 [Cryptomeria japonica]|nr:hypothetical protein SUGI_0716000 [Cryptomeria japonica]
MAMAFTRILRNLIYVSYLILVISVLAQQQDSSPCAITDDGVGVCGYNGICQVSGLSSNCTCPPGFDFVDQGNYSKGCFQNISRHQSCSVTGVKMQKIEQIDWPNNDYWYSNSTNETACQEACIQDCFCTVAIYNNASGTECWKKALPLKNGGSSATRIAFVKVYDDGPPTQSKERKEGKGLMVIGIILMVCSFVFAASLLFIWMKMFELHVPENEMILSDWVYECFKYGSLLKLMEQQERRGIDAAQLERMVLVGLWCIQEDPILRPSMKKVVQMLEGTIEIRVPPYTGST